MQKQEVEEDIDKRKRGIQRDREKDAYIQNLGERKRERQEVSCRELEDGIDSENNENMGTQRDRAKKRRRKTLKGEREMGSQAELEEYIDKDRKRKKGILTIYRIQRD